MPSNTTSSKNRRILILSILATPIFVILTLIIILIIQFHQFLPLIKIAPDLLGMKNKKTYLLLFQNNAELRPGGGFIGSYGLAVINKGKLQQLTIHNTYDADGQLKKH